MMDNEEKVMNDDAIYVDAIYVGEPSVSKPVNIDRDDLPCEFARVKGIVEIDRFNVHYVDLMLLAYRY